MPSSKAINWALLTAFLSLNLVGFGLSHRRRQAEAATQRWLMELKGRQGDALARWHAADSIPIESSLCKGAIGNLKATPAAADHGEAQISLSADLADDKAKKLTNAIHGLALAYRRGTPTALLKCMKSRGE